MSNIFVLPGNAVEHNGVRYEAGEKVSDLSEKEAQTLLKSGVVSESKDEAQTTDQPTDEQVTADAEAAGKKGILGAFK